MIENWRQVLTYIACAGALCIIAELFFLVISGLVSSLLYVPVPPDWNTAIVAAILGAWGFACIDKLTQKLLSKKAEQPPPERAPEAPMQQRPEVDRERAAYLMSAGNTLLIVGSIFILAGITSLSSPSTSIRSIVLGTLPLGLVTVVFGLYHYFKAQYYAQEQPNMKHKYAILLVLVLVLSVLGLFSLIEDFNLSQFSAGGIFTVVIVVVTDQIAKDSFLSSR